MAYRHVDNLYKNQRVLAFTRLFALEKIHGTSAHVGFKDDALFFYAGGEKHNNFVQLFNQEELLAKFRELGHARVTVFGEAYGGKCQGMKEVYGPDLKFIAFEVKIGDSWLAVPDAHQVTEGLGLEFVHYDETPSDIVALDALRDAPSVQARRNGMGEHPREGIVIRPPFEVTMNNGERLAAKHKTEAYQERQKQPKVGETSEVLKAAQAIAQEWVTPMRLTHVLDKMTVDGKPPNIEQMGDIIKAMIVDVDREAAGEIEMDKQARKAIGKRTVALFKARLMEALHADESKAEEKSSDPDKTQQG